VRGFASLLFAVALAAHFGPAGAPSLGTPYRCADELGLGRHAGAHVLYLSAVMGATQTEAAKDGSGRSAGPHSSRVVAVADGRALRPTSTWASRCGAACTPASRLGLPGHPSTAPPLQA